MAKVLITLLGILLLLNAMTFLLVAFQDPGGEATAEDSAASRAALSALSKKVDALTRKVDGLSGLKTLSRELKSVSSTLSRKIDGVARAQAAPPRRSPPPRAVPAEEEDEEEDVEEEVEEGDDQG